jgi:hypothetical protein
MTTLVGMYTPDLTVRYIKDEEITLGRKWNVAGKFADG